MPKKLLTWTMTPSGIQTAESAVLTKDGQALTWHLGGRDGHWGLALTPAQDYTVWRENVTGTEDEAKAAAQAFEDQHRGQKYEFNVVDVLERFHLVGGAFVTRWATSVPDPLHIGELNSIFAQPVLKKLRKARRDGKVLRFVAVDGVAIIPAEQITHVTVLQRWRNTGEEFLGEPGWPQHVRDEMAAEDEAAHDLVEQIMDLADEYATKQVDAAKPGIGSPAAAKAAEAAKEHLRTHVAELVDLDHEH